MTARFVNSRTFKWVLLLGGGPVTGPLALLALRNAQAGDRLAAAGYCLTIPSAWMIMAQVGAHLWR
jgi:hypothetical protein